MTTGERHDPSQVPNRFAFELSRASDERGLTLGRLRAHLERAGVPVSTATLSYWSTGRSRPSRIKSLAAVEALEQILRVEPGRLLNTLPQSVPAPVEVKSLRDRMIDDAIRANDLPTSNSWHQYYVHHRTIVGADGAEKSFETTIVPLLLDDRVQGWTLAISGFPGGVEVEGVTGVTVARVVQVDAESTLFELRLQHPVARGDLVRTQHRPWFPGSGDHAHETGYGLRRQLDRLVLEVVFEGVMPTRFTRQHRAPGADEAVTVAEQVHVSRNTAQAVISQAAPGTHHLTWEW